MEFANSDMQTTKFGILTDYSRVFSCVMLQNDSSAKLRQTSLAVFSYTYRPLNIESKVNILLCCSLYFWSNPLEDVLFCALGLSIIYEMR